MFWHPNLILKHIPGALSTVLTKIVCRNKSNTGLYISGLKKKNPCFIAELSSQLPQVARGEFCTFFSVSDDDVAPEYPQKAV